MKINKKSGFTLIELMVIIAIVTIITLGGINYTQSQGNSLLVSQALYSYNALNNYILSINKPFEASQESDENKMNFREEENTYIDTEYIIPVINIEKESLDGVNGFKFTNLNYIFNKIDNINRNGDIIPYILKTSTGKTVDMGNQFIVSDIILMDSNINKDELSIDYYYNPQIRKGNISIYDKIIEETIFKYEYDYNKGGYEITDNKDIYKSKKRYIENIKVINYYDNNTSNFIVSKIETIGLNDICITENKSNEYTNFFNKNIVNYIYKESFNNKKNHGGIYEFGGDVRQNNNCDYNVIIPILSNF